MRNVIVERDMANLVADEVAEREPSIKRLYVQAFVAGYFEAEPKSYSIDGLVAKFFEWWYFMK